MIDDPRAVFHSVNIGIAAAAGAITAFAFASWRELTYAERALTLVAGFSFAWFIAPMVAERVGWSSPRQIAGLTYILGSGSNILLPLLIKWTGKWVSRVLGGDEPREDRPDG